MPPFGFGRKRSPQPVIGVPHVDLPEFPPNDLAAAVRRALAGQRPPPERTAEVLADVVAQLVQIAESPAEWPNLLQGERRALLQVMMLAHAFAPERIPWPDVEALYRGVAQSLPVAERVRVVQAVAQGIRVGEPGLQALGVAMYADDDPTVVSTASLEYALLTPLERGYAMTGVQELRELAFTTRPAWRAGAILGGAVLHGDRRSPDALHGAWRDLDQPGKQTVTTAIRPGLLLTGTIEFYLRWLEDPHEMELGLPASTLCWLPQIARADGLVREVERSLPANYHATPEEDRRIPPVRVLGQWPVAVYGQRIMPRLVAVWEREGRPEPMRDVMRAWGG